MGTTPSRNDVQFKLTAQTARRHRSPLSEPEAWAIAMTWRAQLRGCVRLETATDPIHPSIVPSFEWVTFVVTDAENGEDRFTLVQNGFTRVQDLAETAAYARAATIVWFALSCCPGYSGTENPGFWKRVFFEYLYPKGLPRIGKRNLFASRRQVPITTAVRFFDDPDKPFPRIKLAIEKRNDPTAECVFLGLKPQPSTLRDAQVRGILDELHPLIRVSSWRRRVPVEVDMLNSSIFKTVELLREAAPSALSRGTRLPSADFPQIKLESIAVSNTDFSSLETLHSLSRSSDTTVLMDLALSDIVRDHNLCRGLLDRQALLTPSKDCLRWRVFRLVLKQSVDLSCSHLGIVCSAIPHLPSITTMNLPTNRYPQGTPHSVVPDWAWLGYAIFHPDAASQSGLVAFQLELNRVTLTDIGALQSMAVGNNLLGGNSSGYLEGRVLPRTKVMKQPSDEGPVLCSFEVQTWVSLCVHDFSFESWVCVVIPGVGLGWVNRDAVIETRSRPPGKSSIRALCVDSLGNSVQENMKAEPIAALLAVLGEGVTSLDLQCSNLLPTSTVQTIVRQCPSLKSLRIHHSGSFWADELLAMEFPALEELELITDTHDDRLVPVEKLKPACLPHIKALRVIAFNRDSFKENERIVTTILASFPVLQYLHWSYGYDLLGQWIDASYFRKGKPTNKFLRQLPPDFQRTHGPVRVVCRLAFLSTLNGRSNIAQLGHDIITLIFQYAASSTQREIVIHP